MRASSLLLILALVLAGCASAPPEPEPTAPTQDVDTGPDTGAISGVVVDAAITPISGATITLKSLGLNLTSAADGTFVIQDLDPGVYFLEASADQFLAIQQTVTVEAGAVAKPIITLIPDPSPVPYQATVTFDGHMVFSDIYAVWYVTYYTGNSTLCQCIFTFDVESGYQNLVLEGDWTPSIDVTGDHELYWEIWGGEAEEGYAATYLAPQESTRQTGAAFGESDGEIWVQVSSGAVPDIEQPFEGFLSFFYVDAAPDGWTFFA